MAQNEPTQDGVWSTNGVNPQARPGDANDPLDPEPAGRVRYDLGDAAPTHAAVPPSKPTSYGHGAYPPRTSPDSTRFVLKPPATGLASEILAAPAAEPFREVPRLDPVNIEPISTQNSSSLLPMGVGIAAVIFLIVGILLVIASIPEPTSMPDSFKRFLSRGSMFSCDAPHGWTAIETHAKGLGDSVLGGVVFTSGAATVAITMSPVPVLDTGAPPTPGDSTEPAQEGAKAEMLNRHYKKEQEKQFKDYRETPAVAIQTQMGEGRVTEWMARDQGIIPLGLIHGFRACLVGKERSALVVCQCREADWKGLKRAFTRLVNSVSERSDGDIGNSVGFTPVVEAPPASIANPSGLSPAPPNAYSAPFSGYPSGGNPAIPDTSSSGMPDTGVPNTGLGNTAPTVTGAAEPGTYGSQSPIPNDQPDFR